MCLYPFGGDWSAVPYREGEHTCTTSVDLKSVLGPIMLLLIFGQLAAEMLQPCVCFWTATVHKVCWKAVKCDLVCHGYITVMPKPRRGARQTQDQTSKGSSWQKRWPNWWPHTRSRWRCIAAGGKSRRTDPSATCSLWQVWQLGLVPGWHRRHYHRRSPTVLAVEGHPCLPAVCDQPRRSLQLHMSPLHGWERLVAIRFPAPIPAPWSYYRACDLHQQGAVEESEVWERRFPMPGEPARKPEVGLRVRPASPPPEAVAPRGLACCMRTRLPVSLGLPTPRCDYLLHGRPPDQLHRRH